MRNVTIKGLLAHKLRLALTSLAIVLGVTFISGSFVLTDTLHSLFDGLVGNIYQKIDFQVRGVAQFPTSDAANAVRDPLAEPLLGTVRHIPGVEAAYGEVSGYAQFLSRQGNFYHAPDWFVAGLPNVPLDGELWLGRRMFQRAVSIVRRHDQSDLWRQISYRAGSATGKELERLRPRDRIAETSRSN